MSRAPHICRTVTSGHQSLKWMGIITGVNFRALTIMVGKPQVSWDVPVRQRTTPGSCTVGAQPYCLGWSPLVSAHPQWSCPPDPAQMSTVAVSNRPPVKGRKTDFLSSLAWLRPELRNSLCYHQIIQLAFKVSSLRCSIVFEFQETRKWRLFTQILMLGPVAAHSQ